MSTTISDGVLFLITIFFAGRLAVANRRLGSFGLITLASAAAIGSLRAGIWPELVEIHASLSTAAGILSITGVALEYLGLAFWLEKRFVWSGCILAVGAAYLAMQVLPAHSVRLAVGLIASIAVVASAIKLKADNRAYTLPLVGISILLFAGTVIGNRGSLLGVLRVDLFHYAIALAYSLLALGVLRLDTRPVTKLMHSAMQGA